MEVCSPQEISKEESRRRTMLVGENEASGATDKGQDMESITDAIQIDENDNVATALRDLQPADAITVKSKNDTKQIILSDLIQYGHKLSLSEIEKDAHIIKYGEVIGIASKKIKKGTHVHIHNVLSLRGRGDLENKNRMG